MRILMVNSLYPPNVRGGAETSVRLLAENVAAAGHEVVVVSTSGETTLRSETHGGVRALYVPVPNLHWPFDGTQHGPLSRKLWHLIDLYNPNRVLHRIIATERPAVVHTHNLQGFSVSAWNAARAARVPVVHTLRDYYLTCARCTRFRNHRSCAQTCAPCVPFASVRRRASRAVDAVIGVSRFILDLHTGLGLFPNAGIKTAIRNPAETGRVPLPSLPRGPRLRLGYLGRLEEMKGIVALAHAIADPRCPDVALTIAGTGAESAQLQKLALASNGRIRLLGWLPKDEVLRHIDLLVIPSLWHEPFSRSLIDAVSAGVPVLAARRGGLPEIIEDGVNGLLFEPREPATLFSAVARLRNESDLLDRLRSGCLATARTLDAAAVATRTLDTYAAIVPPLPTS